MDNVEWCVGDNRTEAPDGEYYVVTQMMDYNDGVRNYNPDSWQLWKSKTKVIVSGGLIDLETAMTASKEVKDKCGYWGGYIEDFSFRKTVSTSVEPNVCFYVSFGS